MTDPTEDARTEALIVSVRCAMAIAMNTIKVTGATAMGAQGWRAFDLPRSPAPFWTTVPDDGPDLSYKRIQPAPESMSVVMAAELPREVADAAGMHSRPGEPSMRHIWIDFRVWELCRYLWALPGEREIAGAMLLAPELVAGAAVKFAERCAEAVERSINGPDPAFAGDILWKAPRDILREAERDNRIARHEAADYFSLLSETGVDHCHRVYFLGRTDAL